MLMDKILEWFLLEEEIKELEDISDRDIENYTMWLSTEFILEENE